MSTHVAGFAARAMPQNSPSSNDAHTSHDTRSPQNSRTPAQIEARATLFAESSAPDTSLSAPTMQARWRASGASFCAIAFWPLRNSALEITFSDVLNESDAPLTSGFTSPDGFTSPGGFTPTSDRVATCDESGAFCLHDARDRDARDASGTRSALQNAVPRRSSNSPKVLCAALSPNSRFLAVGSEDGTIQVRRASVSRRESRQSQAIWKAHEGPVKVLAWSGAKLLASGGAPLLASGGSDGVVRLWDAHNPKRRQIISESEHSITALAWSQDGNWLASGDDRGTISVWNVRGVGNEALGRRKSPGHTEIGDSELRVAELMWTKTKHEFWVSALCFSPNNRALASGGYDGTARVWSCDSGVELQLLEGHGGVSAAAFSPDNRTLCCGGSDGAIKLWDSWTGYALHSLPSSGAGVRALAFAARAPEATENSSEEAALENDSRLQTLAVATAREVQVWRW